MQLLGAWMMKTPLSRAFAMTSFIRGAISAIRSTARLQWWRSHMSQIMMAVFFASQCCGRSRTWKISGSVSEGARSRRTRDSSLELASAPATHCGVVRAKRRRVEQIATLGVRKWYIMIDPCGSPLRQESRVFTPATVVP